jgi:c(7)-type cytochrome triheme protein
MPKTTMTLTLLLTFVTHAVALATVGGGDITLKNKGGAVLFSHDAHVAGMGLTCTQCHDKLYTNARQHKIVSMKEMQKSKSCGACHNGKTAFSVQGDCTKCHKK